MSPIVLRHEELIMMPGKIDYRRLEIENLIERCLGSCDALGEFFDPRIYSLEGFSSSHCVSTQSSGLTGNRLVAKVPRRMLGFRYGGIVWAGIEFCHEEVDLLTAQKFRDNAEAPFIQRDGDCNLRATAVGAWRYIPQTVTGTPAPAGARRKILSAQGRSGVRSNTIRCPASAPQRSI